MAREVTIMTPEQVEVRFELAGIGSRFIALLVDTMLQGLMFLGIFLAIWAFGLTNAFEFFNTKSLWMVAILILIVFVITNGYFLYFEATKNGQTPGKKSAGIRVVRDTGHPVDFRSALLRNVMRIVDSLPMVYGVGIISAFLSPQYRRLGDYVGGTLVVKVGRNPDMLASRTPAAASVAPGGWIDAPVPGTVQAPSSAAITPESMVHISEIDKDEYRTIRHFLDRRIELEAAVAEDLSRKLADPIARKIGIDPATIDEPASFLQAISIEWERRMVH